MAIQRARNGIAALQWPFGVKLARQPRKPGQCLALAHQLLLDEPGREPRRYPRQPFAPAARALPQSAPKPLTDLVKPLCLPLKQGFGPGQAPHACVEPFAPQFERAIDRSEDHTSELQSQST